MSKRCYAVAKSEQAMKERLEESDYTNWDFYYPPDEEVLFLLANGGAFNMINKTCNLLIDEYEEEVIKGENLLKAATILNSIPGSDRFVFSKALRRAIELGTAISLGL